MAGTWAEIQRCVLSYHLASSHSPNNVDSMLAVLLGQGLLCPDLTACHNQDLLLIFLK
jgi:hypothetical protein